MAEKRISIRINRHVGSELNIAIESNVEVSDAVVVAVLKLYERLEEK